MTMIGLLPTSNSIRLAAPVILIAVRLVQGIPVGGAMSFIAKYAPSKRRGFYTGWQTFTIALALLVGAAVASIITTWISVGDLRA